MFQFLNPLVWPEGRKLELNVIKRIFLVVKKREPYLITLDSISHPSGRFCRPKVALFRPLGSALIGLDEVTKKMKVIPEISFGYSISGIFSIIFG